MSSTKTNKKERDVKHNICIAFSVAGSPNKTGILFTIILYINKWKHPNKKNPGLKSYNF